MNLRLDALTILHRALEAVDLAKLFRENVRVEGQWLTIGKIPPTPLSAGGRTPAGNKGVIKVNLNEIRRLVVIGTGKGTAPMAQAAEEILGDRISAGAITVKYGHGLLLKKIRVIEAGHPFPDQATLDGTTAILNLVRGLDEKDLVLALISGGGSSLLEMPVPPMTLADLQAVNASLLACGADITEMNAVRRHVSRVKGGGLAQAAHPARVFTLAVSDVIGDPPESIASGPTAPDPSTFADAWMVVEKYALTDRLPASVVQHLMKGLSGKIPDTPKPSDPIFKRAVYRIIGSNRIMLEAARQTAVELGYETMILTSRLTGEARDKGQELAAMLKVRRSSVHPECLLAGGETTVTLKGAGKGGRNQELALSAAIELDGANGCLLLSAGSDGTDGPTDAAGAIADGTTIRRAETLRIQARDYLDRHDSYPFFQALGDLIVTGPTRTNVMDIIMILTS